jgi:hypothetical protein
MSAIRVAVRVQILPTRSGLTSPSIQAAHDEEVAMKEMMILVSLTILADHFRAHIGSWR